MIKIHPRISAMVGVRGSVHGLLATKVGMVHHPLRDSEMGGGTHKSRRASIEVFVSGMVFHIGLGFGGTGWSLASQCRGCDGEKASYPVYGYWKTIARGGGVKGSIVKHHQIIGRTGSHRRFGLTQSRDTQYCPR